MLDRSSVVDSDRNRRYLLEKTQHLVGGFGKVPGDPPGMAKKKKKSFQEAKTLTC